MSIQALKIIPFQEPTEVSAALQPASEDICDRKYRLKDKSGIAVDETIDGTYRRVAQARAEVEPEDRREHWFERFLWALRNGAIPAGRIISNAGAQEHKPATSTINCTVSGTIEDSMLGILEKNLEAGLTLMLRQQQARPAPRRTQRNPVLAAKYCEACK